MNGLYLKVQDAHKEKMDKIRIAEFMILDASSSIEEKQLPVNQWIPVVKKYEEPKGAFRFLKCLHCGHHDFNSDGVGMNDYCCNGCGLGISIVEHVN